MTKKLRVGFDFDGVIAYNPFRIVRLPMSILSRFIGKEDKVITYCPRTRIEEWFWILLHETSFFPATGFEQLKTLLSDTQIECYLLTSRYACLEPSFYRWLKKHNIDKAFKGYYLNKKNEEPHKFKERILNSLKLDYYIDDNWGIVEYLVGQSKAPASTFKTQVHWIYNILERTNPYSHKHPYLGKFIEMITMEQKKNK